MRKIRGIIAIVVVFAVACVLGAVWFMTSSSLGGNEKELQKAVMKLEEDNASIANGDSVELALNNIVPFKWDKVYSFTPYTTVKYMEEITGIKSDKYEECLYDEGMQLAFVEGKKVVAFVSGRASELGFQIKFSDCLLYEDDAIFLANKKDGVILLSYICNRNDKASVEAREDAKQQFLENMPGNMYYAEVDLKDGSFLLFLASSVEEKDDGTSIARSCDVYYGKDTTIRRIDALQSEEAIVVAPDTGNICIVKDGQSQSYAIDVKSQELILGEESSQGEILEFNKLVEE